VLAVRWQLQSDFPVCPPSIRSIVSTQLSQFSLLLSTTFIILPSYLSAALTQTLPLPSPQTAWWAQGPIVIPEVPDTGLRS
jgi:hypothetical protein